MYMYYLLGYKYFGDLDMMEKLYTECPDIKGVSTNRVFTGFGSLLNNIDSRLRNRVRISFRLITCIYVSFLLNLD